MKRRAGMVRFWAVTIILVVVTAFCCTGTALCRADFGGEESERYYREREQILVKEAGEYLVRQGYENSGLMLTRVVNGDGSRVYTLSIHHSRIKALSGEERKRLTDGLEDFFFTDQECVFRINL